VPAGLQGRLGGRTREAWSLAGNPQRVPLGYVEPGPAIGSPDQKNTGEDSNGEPDRCNSVHGKAPSVMQAAIWGAGCDLCRGPASRMRERQCFRQRKTPPGPGGVLFLVSGLPGFRPPAPGQKPRQPHRRLHHHARRTPCHSWRLPHPHPRRPANWPPRPASGHRPTWQSPACLRS